jgi:Uma2 family endonuclease
MAEATTRRLRWNVSDLELLPDDGKRREVIDGELFVSTQPHFYHQLVSMNVARVLLPWNDQNDLGFVVDVPGVVFSPEDAVAPDLIWLSRARFGEALDPSGHLRIAPELVVEILSPGAANERRDREAKLKLYSERGVREYWIVDWRTRQVEVYRRNGMALVLAGTLYAEDVLDSPVLPGFRCQVSQLFTNVPA